ncbi:LysE family translocator [Hyphomicrobium sp. CS1BSMeth3]|uniref:LysE family translocator n=1 Tax=Hyphomicrobium sp. CS1BSMeth3 TaxID=1892844 RepID=UPI000931B415|nr:LysE family translocator [Hyphomicrobium sp. CS1BSMeth3]
MDYFGILLTIAVVQFLGAASPGPNFMIVTSYAINGSRRLALLASCGILLATLTWALLAATSVGVVMLRMPYVYQALQLAGALYLIWFGGKLLIGALRENSAVKQGANKQPHSGMLALRAGYTTSMTNPKSLAYYTSIFAVVMPKDSPDWLLAAAVSTAILVSAAWWASVAIFLTVPPIRSYYERAQRGINAVMGGLLVCLGLRLALTR